MLERVELSRQAEKIWGYLDRHTYTIIVTTMPFQIIRFCHLVILKYRYSISVVWFREPLNSCYCRDTGSVSNKGPA